MLKAFVLPLALDSLAAAAAMGAAQETAVWQRLSIPVVLVIFEGMPLIGLVLGSVLAEYCSDRHGRRAISTKRVQAKSGGRTWRCSAGRATLSGAAA